MENNAAILSILLVSGVSAFSSRDASAYHVRKTESGGEVRWMIPKVQVVVDSTFGDDQVPALASAVEEAVTAWNAASALELEFDRTKDVRKIADDEQFTGIVVRWA